MFEALSYESNLYFVCRCPLSFTAAYSLKSEKDLPFDLLNCEAAGLTAFTTMQQNGDNLIVKDYCYIIEIFDKFSFSGILRGCLSHSDEA